MDFISILSIFVMTCILGYCVACSVNSVLRASPIALLKIDRERIG